MEEWILVTSEGFKVSVDKEDYDKFFGFALWLDKQGYVYTWQGGRNTYLHHLITARMKFDEIKTIDHKDNNKLNCKRNNLRTATQRQNNANTPPSTRKSSFDV